MNSQSVRKSVLKGSKVTIKKILPHSVPSLKLLVEHRDCLIFKDANKTWPISKSDSKLVSYLHMNNTESNNYTLLANALLFLKHSNTASVASRLYASLKATDQALERCKKISKSFCEQHKLDVHSVSIESAKTTDLKNMNIVEFLCNLTHDFSMRFMADQLRMSLTSPTSENCYPKDGTVNRFLHEITRVVEWENKFKKHATNIQFQLEGSQSHKTEGLMELVVARKVIDDPIVIGVPGLSEVLKGSSCDIGEDCLYSIFQFCIRLPDNSLESVFKSMSVFDKVEIEEILAHHSLDPSKYYAHQRLALNIINLIDDSVKLDDCIKVSEYLYNNRGSKPSDSQLERLLHTVMLPFHERLTVSQLLELIVQADPGLQSLIDKMLDQPNFSPHDKPGIFYPSLRKEFLSYKDMDNGSTILLQRSSKNTTGIFIKWQT